ncbi:MAG: hypothetical protein H7Y39_04225 [Nitrospiraceae bacterium]|nr:hypothetical protein [Nitrospiraceae bacterium]
MNEATSKIHIAKLQRDRFTESASSAEQKQKERLFLPVEWIHVLDCRFEIENLAGL